MQATFHLFTDIKTIAFIRLSTQETDHEDEDDDMSDSAAAAAAEEDREKQKKDRERRAEASLREREREVQRTLATHLRDRDKERQHHRHTEAVQHFNALLADLVRFHSVPYNCSLRQRHDFFTITSRMFQVRNGDLAWREAKRQLRKDHRWELVDTLDREEKERLFNEHVEQLGRKKRDKFREVLDEVGASTDLQAAWKDVKKLLKDDPRYLKYSSSDRVSGLFILFLFYVLYGCLPFYVNSKYNSLGVQRY